MNSDEPFWRKMAASQKAQERPYAPSFQRMLARARRAPAVRSTPERAKRPLLWVGAVTAATAAIALAVVTMHPVRHGSVPDAAARYVLKRQIDEAIASLQAQSASGATAFSWRSSTDFLLTANNYDNSNNTKP